MKNAILEALEKASQDEVREFLTPFAAYGSVSSMADLLKAMEGLYNFKKAIMEQEMNMLLEKAKMEEKRKLSEDLKKVGLPYEVNSPIITTIHSLKEDERPLFIKELLKGMPQVSSGNDGTKEEKKEEKKVEVVNKEEEADLLGRSKE